MSGVIKASWRMKRQVEKMEVKAGMLAAAGMKMLRFFSGVTGAGN